MNKYNKLLTEAQNPSTLNIDECSTDEMLHLINAEDQTVPMVVKGCIPDIAKAVDLIYQKIKQGGSLIYLGAGTSGRLGLLDAFECPPTFGVSPDMVKAFIAGGEKALTSAKEENEDSYDDGVNVIKDNNITSRDVVLGLSASGSTPYVLGGLDAAKQASASTVAIINNPNEELKKLVDVQIVAQTGPEVITGSTRMKAGTAQKLILNMISTSVMIKLGKVYQNLMVDVEATNQKLVNRSIKNIMLATNTSFEESQDALQKAQGSAKLAILLLLLNCSVEVGKSLLDKHSGNLSLALKDQK